VACFDVAVPYRRSLAVARSLRLLDEGAPSAAGDLLKELQTIELAKAEVLLTQLPAR
jgi:hypothetical protein